MLRTKGINTQPVDCAHCGATCAPGTAERVENWDYDWDDPDEDAQGSAQVMLAAWWQHPVGPECVREAIRTGHNDRFLAEALRDRSLPDDVRAEAREALRKTAEVMQAMARADDMAARERGWGVIGGPRAGAGGEW